MHLSSDSGRSISRRLPRRWAGLDLCPLLHESAYSVISRFAQRNALDFSTLKSVLRQQTSGAAGRGFFCSSADIERWVNELTGWSWRSHEVLLEPVSAVLTCGIWSQTLRYCPICLEAGFHSIWYQAEILTNCPFHGCQLISFCQECGATTGAYGFSTALFREPYSCWNCRGPIAGAAFDVSEHLSIRSDQLLIHAKLRTCLQWFAAVTEHFRFLSPTRCFFVPCLGPGYDARCLVRQLVCFVEPFSNDSRTGGEITVLTWHVVARSSSPNSCMTIKRQGWARYGQAQGAYRATLRLLRRAIDAEVGGADETISLTATSRFVIGLSEIDPYVLSYLLLRFVFERTRTWRFDWRSDLAAISDEPIRVGPNGERLSRRCVRAVVLGAYVGILALVERGRARGELNLNVFCVTVDTLICQCIQRSDGSECGFVVFPKLPWLPTRNLRTDRLSVLSTFEKLAAAAPCITC